MSREWIKPVALSDEEGPDPEVGAWLGSIDPADRDANYWLRFQGWVMTEAGPELARRRLMAELTVGDLLAGWARALVPAAVAASLAAGFLLVRAGQERDDLASTATVEEILVAGMGYQPIPVTLVEAEASLAVSFAEERF